MDGNAYPQRDITELRLHGRVMMDGGGEGSVTMEDKDL